MIVMLAVASVAYASLTEERSTETVYSSRANSIAGGDINPVVGTKCTVVNTIAGTFSGAPADVDVVSVCSRLHNDRNCTSIVFASGIAKHYICTILISTV